MDTLLIKWACPKCGAHAHKHGAGGSGKCRQSYAITTGVTYADIHTGKFCDGFICDCENNNYDDVLHGESYANPCPKAYCYHCLWTGRFPILPKALETWEKKALAAGWSMPDKRKKELKL
jgi:hypothetical protein